MKFFDRLFKRSTASRDDEIANAAMQLSLEWGTHFGKPIQDRLLQQYPDLTRERADELDEFCRQVKRFAFDLYYDEVTSGKSTDMAVQKKIHARYPFLHRDTLNRLSTQGMYYAHK
ncbi:MAG: hypothetical protein HY868_07845 [Chloroflexi bacterium]|nr:hypothetical protein [Chloroflexota bacterium]